MEGLGANKSQKAICKVGRAIGVLASAIDSFDKDLGVPYQSLQESRDLQTIVKQLLSLGGPCAYHT